MLSLGETRRCLCLVMHDSTEPGHVGSHPICGEARTRGPQPAGSARFLAGQEPMPSALLSRRGECHESQWAEDLDRREIAERLLPYPSERLSQKDVPTLL